MLLCFHYVALSRSAMPTWELFSLHMNTEQILIKFREDNRYQQQISRYIWHTASQGWRVHYTHAESVDWFGMPDMKVLVVKREKKFLMKYANSTNGLSIVCLVGV